MKKLLAIGLAWGLGAWLSCAPATWAQEGDTPKEPKKTKKAADDEEEENLPAVPAALKGKDFVLPAKLNTKAKVYFIYQSRSTCSICVAEAPAVADAYKRMKGKKAELVMLNIDADKKVAAKWAKDAKMKFPIVAPGEHAGVPFPYEITGEAQMLLPQMVAVDAEGNKLGQANGSNVAAFVRDWKKVVKEYEKGEKKKSSKKSGSAEAE